MDFPEGVTAGFCLLLALLLALICSNFANFFLISLRAENDKMLRKESQIYLISFSLALSLFFLEPE